MCLSDGWMGRVWAAVTDSSELTCPGSAPSPCSPGRSALSGLAIALVAVLPEGIHNKLHHTHTVRHVER